MVESNHSSLSSHVYPVGMVTLGRPRRGVLQIGMRAWLRSPWVNVLVMHACQLHVCLLHLHSMCLFHCIMIDHGCSKVPMRNLMLILWNASSGVYDWLHDYMKLDYILVCWVAFLVI